MASKVNARLRGALAKASQEWQKLIDGNEKVDELMVAIERLTAENVELSTATRTV